MMSSTSKFKSLNCWLFALVCLLLCGPQKVCGQLTTADFLRQPTFTDSILWANLVGVNIYLDDIVGVWNSTNFQGYFRNSNLNSNWGNNFPINIKMPKGWFYNCTTAKTTQNGVACNMELEGNTTFFEEFGSFVWNTCSQPYWTLGLNDEKFDLYDYDLLESLFYFFIDVYKATFYIIFNVEMMAQGDLAVENGRRNAGYNSDVFYEQAYQYEEIVFGLIYRAPGLTQAAGPEWLSNLAYFFEQVWIGIFTIEAVIFEDPSLVTIENLLDDNYTKGFMRRRTYVTPDLSYASFQDYPTAFSSVKFMEGDGVDGVTNTMAAAIWYVDFFLEAALYYMYDVNWEGDIYSGNYQSFLGPAPSYTPSAIYYAMIFANLARDGSPTVVLSSTTAGTSDKIKVWGLETRKLFKFVILNKDPNPALNGKVNVQLQSTASALLRCIYMSAPSLDSTSSDMEIGGYKYMGDSSFPQGNYEEIKYEYNPSIFGYAVNISYAQICICSIPNVNLIIPKVDECWSGNLAPLLIAIIGLLTLLAI